MAPPSLLSGKDPCQFLQVHARKGKPGFHLHPRLPYVLCITESVSFFRSPEDPLYGLLPLGIDILVPTGMADVLHCLLSGMAGCAPPGRYNSHSTRHIHTHTS